MAKKKHIPIRATIYQIIVKGEERNKTFDILLEGMKARLLRGDPLAKQDVYGTVIRSIEGREFTKPVGGVQLSLVKYNGKQTGLAWDIDKEELLSENSKVTAQKTELIIFTKEHVAIHIQKTHGPSPSNIQNYLEQILREESIQQEVTCDIEILPIRHPGLIKEIKNWKTIRSFKLKVYRPNPDGTLKIKKIKELLDQSNSDKLEVKLDAKAAGGISYSGIKDLVEEGVHLVEQGQGTVEASGFDEDGERLGLDSKEQKVKNFEIKATLEEYADLAKFVFNKLKGQFTK